MPGHHPYANDVDLQALRELKGGERLWAHAALEEALENQRDPRAPRALAYGSSIHSLDFLREIAPELDGPVAQEVRKAIQTLAQLA
jgi:hypothetical protein